MIFKTLSAVLLGVVIVHAPLAAQEGNDRVLRGPLPEWASVSDPLPLPEDAQGLMFIRRQDTIVRLEEGGQRTFSAFRIHLLHPNALQLGNITIGWNPASGSPMVHRLIVHRDGEQIDALADREFEILRREDQLEAAMLDGILTAVLKVPDLRVGDELELAFTVPSHTPSLPDRSFGILALADNPPPGRFRLSLSWEDGQEPAVQWSGDLQDAIVRRPGAVQLQADMPGPLNPPKDAPPRYGWQRVLEYSDFGDWQSISRRFDTLFDEASTLSEGSPLRSEAQRIAAAHASDLDRAQAALELVQKQVRYIFVGLGTGSLTPASADETWQRRYGDCKGKTALLLALLGELGIEAEAVLANNSGMDDGLDERLPSPGMFDHVLVRARIGGQTYWMDGTLPAVATAATRPVVPYRWVLPLADTGSPIEQVAWQPDPLPTELVVYEVDARAGFDEPATIRRTSVKRGPQALVEYMQFSALTGLQLENAFRSNLSGSSEWNRVYEVNWRFDIPTQASVLEIVGSGPVDWDDDGDGARSLTLPGGGFNPPGRRQRNADQDQTAPYSNESEFDCRVTTVRLPEKTRPWYWRHNATFDTKIYGNTYRRDFELRDGDIRMIRSFRVERREISADQARADNARLSDFDNSMAHIFYDPDRNAPTASDGSTGAMRVPASHERDWVADASACLVRESSR